MHSQYENTAPETVVLTGETFLKGEDIIIPPTETVGKRPRPSYKEMYEKEQAKNKRLLNVNIALGVSFITSFVIMILKILP